MDGRDARGEQMNVALITIATGQKYRQYAGTMFLSAKKFFPEAHRIAFTDGIGAEDPEADVIFPFVAYANQCLLIPPAGFPEATLMRYHTMLKFKHELAFYDQIFWIDADMLFVAPVGEEIFSNGLTATLHPGYIGTRGTPETRKESAAFTPNNTSYYCGGFQGGDAKHYLSAVLTMAQGINLDIKAGVQAIWHDESHWNNYLSAFELPAKVLGPEYCYPDVTTDYYRDKWRAAGLGHVEPKILALTKVAQ
jgi:histo-blood group ABO system transferase